MTDKLDRDRQSAKNELHPIEWVTGAVSAIGVVALLAYLVIVAIWEPNGPAVFETTVDEMFASDGGWQVRVTVRNVGYKTAADVVLRGEAGAGEAESEMTFDYVPAGSQRSGALLFADEPEGLALTVRSYTDP